MNFLGEGQCSLEKKQIISFKDSGQVADERDSWEIKKVKIEDVEIVEQLVDSDQVHDRDAFLVKMESCDDLSGLSEQVDENIVPLKEEKLVENIIGDANCEYIPEEVILKKIVDANSNQHQCQSCDYVSNMKDHLETHIKSVHSNSKQHKCNLDESASNQENIPNAHIETRNKNYNVSGELRKTDDLVDFILNNKFSEMPYDDQIFITKTLKIPRPPMQNLIISAKYNRSFCVQWYDKCDWLTGSPVRNKLFCWICLLFSDDSENHIWSKLGYSDLKNLPRSIERHSRLRAHLGASIRFKLFGKVNIVNSLDEGQKQTIIYHNQKVKENRDILRRLLDAVMFLCFQELPFGGHDEISDSDNAGNFKELLSLISRYDSKLEKFLSDGTFFSGTSETIQDDLMDAISIVVQDKIQSELQNALFFSWQIDETINVTCSSQISVIFRYVNNEGLIVKRFAGFFANKDKTTDSLFKLLTETFNTLNLERKLIAQTYDGASVMAGHLNGLQAKIKNIAPHALFTHCYAHALNLVLSEACSGSIKECKNFFANLSGFSAFFSKSTRRIQVLNSVGSNQLPSNEWNFTSRVVSTVFSNRDKLIQAFDHIINHESFAHDHQTIREAIGLKKYLYDFEFIFLLHTFNFIFEHTNVVFSILQNELTHISLVKKRIVTLINTLQDFRNIEVYFNRIYNRNFEAFQTDKPQSKRRKTTFNFSNLKHYHLKIFNEILDTIIDQIRIRFADLDKLEFFDLVRKEKFGYYCEEFPESLFNSLLKHYPFFEPVVLRNELLIVYAESELFKNIETLVEMMSFIFKNDLVTCLPEYYKLLCLILSIPVTSPSVESDLSALKRINSFSRNTIGQDRLKNMSLISIEKRFIKQLAQQTKFYDEVIDVFADQKDRPIALKFKKI